MGLIEFFEIVISLCAVWIIASALRRAIIRTAESGKRLSELAGKERP
jgi:hypothetical protein